MRAGHAAWHDAPAWCKALQEAGMPALRYPQDYDPQGPGKLEDVKFAVVWKPPEDLLSACPNLQAVQSLGAGVDSILRPGVLPEGIPLARIVRSAAENAPSDRYCRAMLMI